MLEFRKLALEFVLEDDELKLSSIAKNAAAAIQEAPENTNPVARWVEAVQPWMPGGRDANDPMQNEVDPTDWPARAKALEFLSRTLNCLGTQVLTQNQVNLLIAFFGAMFEVDHKAGIMASAVSLARISSMKSFQPRSGLDIIQKICALKDDFHRQVPKTRLAIYQLIQSLITSPAVARDLQIRDGTSEFMRGLVQLCQNERDPECLMVWFDILAIFLTKYSPSEDLLAEVYANFKAYFPITLPRASQSGVTSDELKLQLRNCFSSNQLLAPLTLPFLLEKLDHGDGATVNVKLDILRTIRACLRDYTHPELSIAPFSDRLWASLRYEVRNGEVEDLIWATLEVLKALTTRLLGDELRDYTSKVLRDCGEDFSSPTYSAAAGRLLVSVLSASPAAFTLMAPTAISHIKANLLNAKSASHKSDLMRVLLVILESRLLLIDSQADAQNFSAFYTIDSVFKTLWADVLRSPIQVGRDKAASPEDIQLSTEAAQAAGALVCQKRLKEEKDSVADLLLEEDACEEICGELFSTIAWFIERERRPSSDELVNESVRALQRAIQAFPAGFNPLIERGMSIIQKFRVELSPASIETVRKLCPILAFVGCSELPSSPGKGLAHFLCLVVALTAELLAAIDSRGPIQVWCDLAAGIQTAVRFFSEACPGPAATPGDSWEPKSWVSRTLHNYPVLSSLEGTNDAGSPAHSEQLLSNSECSDASAVRADFLLVSFFVARLLYRKATKAIVQRGQKMLVISDDFAGVDAEAHSWYFQLISNFAGFVVHEMSDEQQLALHVEEFSVNLFCNDLLSPPSPPDEIDEKMMDVCESWDWLLLGPLNVLSFGILEGLRPAAVKYLYDVKVGEHMLLQTLTLPPGNGTPATRPTLRAMLAVLANKYPLETRADILSTVEQTLKGALQEATAAASFEDAAGSIELALSIFALTSGFLRRCSGKPSDGLLELIGESITIPSTGHRLARGLEVLVMPVKYLTKEQYAVVKPLWMQKLYLGLVRPMVEMAIGNAAGAESASVKANASSGLMLMVKHMSFAIYEEDSGKIVRIAISIIQGGKASYEAQAALEITRIILAEAPDKVEPHLRSIVDACTSLISTGSRALRSPAPGDGAGSGGIGVVADCGKLALEILGGLPHIFEPRHVLPLAPIVRRELSIACGHPVREARQVARRARTAWEEVQ